MEPLYFKNQEEFRAWLEKNHKKEAECIVGYYKVSTGKPSLTWSESVDQAICYGWIDGIRRSIDEESYCIRFTPRRPDSNWSKVNIKKVKELTSKGLMKPAGIEVFKNRKKEKSGVYSYENDLLRFTDQFDKQFRQNKQAWDFYQNQPPSYRKTIIQWVMSAKQEKTRQSRFDKLVAASMDNKRIY